MKEAILRLWHECHNPLQIAQKLGIVDAATGEPDVDKVERIISDQVNYPNRRRRNVRHTAPIYP